MRSAIDAVSTEELSAAFETSDDPRFQALINAMADPANSNIGLLKLMRKHDITFAALLNCWKDYNHAVALMRAQSGVSQVYADVVEDAQSTYVVCPDCKEHQERDPADCEVCQGTGQVRIKGDDAARRMVFEHMGWAGKRAPLINNNLVLPQSYPSISKTSGDVSRLLDAPDTIDAEVIEAPEDSH